MGKYIVSNDDSTMNEYITDNKLGFLFNKKNNKVINHGDVINNLDYRIQFAQKGYSQWLREKDEIMKFFFTSLNKEKRNLITEILFFLDLLKFYIKKFL